MTAFRFHLSDGLAGRTDTVSGDEIETLDQVREAVAQAGSEAMRSLARSSTLGGKARGKWRLETAPAKRFVPCRSS